MSNQETWTVEQARERLKKSLPKRNKYGNKKVIIDGIEFDSQKEADRWGELKLLQREGIIKNLRRQVEYKFSFNGKKICSYFADAVYDLNADDDICKGWIEVVEDSKGFRTKEYKLKKKMMLIFYNISILET